MTEDLMLLQEKVTWLRSEGKYKETIEACHNLLEWGMAANDHKSVLVAHLNKIASYYCIGDIEEAFNNISTYNELCIIYGDEIDKLNLYNILFLLYEFNKDFNKAKATLEVSIELGKKLNKYTIISNGYSNYSHIYYAEENYEGALKMAKEGLETAKLLDPASPILELRVKLNIAKAYIGLENFEASKLLIDEMIHDPILDSFVREKSNCYDLQGNWYFKQALYRDAFESYTQAKDLVESYNDVYLLKEIQAERCKLCDLMNDVQLGYLVQKEYISILNQISKRELELVALRLNIKHSITDIEKKANTDYLTGLYNRKYIEHTANLWLEQASITNENIVCIAFDIDNFKSINDTYGHLFGDEVIQQVSKSFSKKFGEHDLIGRYGGDEFIIILRNISLRGGKIKAEQIEESFKSIEIMKNGLSISITASIGVSDNSGGTVITFTDLFQKADVELYKAKLLGKNQISCGS